MALLAACRANDIEEVARLLGEARVDVDEADQFLPKWADDRGETPLMVALILVLLLVVLLKSGRL